MKNQFQDMIPKGSKTIPIQRMSDAKLSSNLKRMREQDEIVRIQNTKAHEGRYGGRKFSKFFLFTILLIALVIIGLAFSSLFDSATIVLKTQSVKASINSQFTAGKVPKSGELGYELMTISRVDTATVDAKFSTSLGTKASGTVVLVNAYNPQPQTIVANSRLQSLKNNIYRTSKTVIIPGYKIVSGKKVPGSIEVKVIADKVGPESNLLMSELSGDFTFPGLSTNPDKFKLIYGRAKTDILGGSNGSELVPDSASEKNAKIDLQNKILLNLKSSISSQIPEGYTYIDGANTVLFENMGYKSIGDKNSTSPKVELIVKGTLHAMIFKTENIGKYLFGKNLEIPQGSYAVFEDINKLAFSFVKPISNLQNENSVAFKLKGDIIAKNKIDEKVFKDKLLGVKSGDSQKILTNFPSIINANFHISPFWSSKLPKSPEKIIIKYVD